MRGDFQGTSFRPAHDVVAAQPIAFNLYSDESGIGLAVEGLHNLGGCGLPGSPTQQARVAQLMASGERQQRQSAASMLPEDPGFLLCGPMSTASVAFKWFSFHPDILPCPAPSA
jgi:hypothetical protein